MKIYVLSGALAVSAVLTLSAQAGEHCSIHPPKGATDAQLASLAKVTQAAAQEVALKRIRSQAAKSVQSAELEAEHGCLLWSFDVNLAGKPGIEEVQVDAGTGKVLSVHHETARQEAAEAAKEGAPHK